MFSTLGFPYKISGFVNDIPHINLDIVPVYSWYLVLYSSYPSSVLNFPGVLHTPRRIAQTYRMRGLFTALLHQYWFFDKTDPRKMTKIWITGKQVSVFELISVEEFLCGFGEVRCQSLSLLRYSQKLEIDR